VIPHGIGDHYLQACPAPLGERLASAGVRPPYLLYLGGDIPRKRLDWAIRVWGEMSDPRMSLVVCGVERQAWPGVREMVDPILRPRLCLLPFVAEADMPRLYMNAVAVLYPTLYEGFGFPALEAQAVGTPVLFSALGSLVELQGPGAVVLPAQDLGAWVGACRKLAERGERSRPDERARDWARQFSWDVCAARHLEVYRRTAARWRESPARGPEANTRPVGSMPA
jgi:alpha-1,3-rhamnosyl/mannosyltransferase